MSWKWPNHGLQPSWDTTQQTRNVASTSLQRRCNVVMLQRRCNDVVCLLGKMNASWGKDNDKTNVLYETTDAQKKKSLH